MEYKFTIKERPIPKKNNPIVRVIPRRGAKRCHYCNNWTKTRYIVSQPAEYRKYEANSVMEVINQKNKMRLRMITEEVHCQVLYWLKDWRGKPDLINLEEATADILQRATVIKDDNQIKNWDGSRIMGVDKENPRVEITLKTLEANNG